MEHDPGGLASFAANTIAALVNQYGPEFGRGAAGRLGQSAVETAGRILQRIQWKHGQDKAELESELERQLSADPVLRGELEELREEVVRSARRVFAQTKQRTTPDEPRVIEVVNRGDMEARDCTVWVKWPNRQEPRRVAKFVQILPGNTREHVVKGSAGRPLPRQRPLVKITYRVGGTWWIYDFEGRHNQESPLE